MSSRLWISFEGQYQVSKKEDQITKQKVNYLGYILTPGSRQLSQERIKAITELTPPAKKKKRFNFLLKFDKVWFYLKNSVNLFP